MKKIHKLSLGVFAPIFALSVSNNSFAHHLDNNASYHEASYDYYDYKKEKRDSFLNLVLNVSGRFESIRDQIDGENSKVLDLGNYAQYVKSHNQIEGNETSFYDLLSEWRSNYENWQASYDRLQNRFKELRRFAYDEYYGWQAPVITNLDKIDGERYLKDLKNYGYTIVKFDDGMEFGVTLKD